jgi:uncharacterized OB-fold protein
VGSLEQIERVDQLGQWPGEIPVSFLYTAGVAGERFLRELKDKGRFLGSRCPDCDYTYLPPRLYCERCFAELKDWVPVGPRGTVEALTVAHLGLDGEPLARPETFALIRWTAPMAFCSIASRRRRRGAGGGAAVEPSSSPRPPARAPSSISSTSGPHEPDAARRLVREPPSRSPDSRHVAIFRHFRMMLSCIPK